MKSDQEKQRFYWLTFVVTTGLTVFLAIPSWLPVFGVAYEDFGGVLWTALRNSLPVITALFGFISGWFINDRRVQKKIEDQEECNKTPKISEVEKDDDIEKPKKKLQFDKIDASKLSASEAKMLLCIYKDKDKAYIDGNPDCLALEQKGAIKSASNSNTFSFDIVTNWTLTQEWQDYIKNNKTEIENIANRSKQN